MSEPVVEVIGHTHARLGEGPMWVAKDKVLLWVDIMGQAVHVYDPDTDKDRTIQLDQKVGTIVPRKNGGAIVALHRGFAELDLQTGEYKLLPNTPDPSQDGARFNDGKCDPRGRLWAGSMDLDEKDSKGNLYMLDKGVATVQVPNVTISNGLCWSGDHKRFFFIDTPTRSVDCFDYDVDTGNISNRRSIISIFPSTSFSSCLVVLTCVYVFLKIWGGRMG
eukprot:TRINITY_DN1873_c0_g1_i2.p1 TRINITY_DN1873_c0_g1~~TRINITY_DN1873_c0_g1_i2.p1  ORF type:complete len:220 (-),score=37.51 TRINITY_DN1873_c0_g1_i2:347-1006(-)